jgi:hypothetical protein
VALRDAYERLWASAIDEGVAAGVFRVEHPAVTRLALLEMCSGVARWYSPRGPLALDQLAEHYAELVSRALGCTAPPGVADLRRCREIVAKEWGMSV